MEEQSPITHFVNQHLGFVCAVDLECSAFEAGKSGNADSAARRDGHAGDCNSYAACAGSAFAALC